MFEPRGSAGTRNPTFGAPGRGAPEFVFHRSVLLRPSRSCLTLDEPSIYRYGLGTLETERSNMNHIVDMINIEMFVGFRVPADPLDSNTGVRAEISPSAYLHLTALL